MDIQISPASAFAAFTAGSKFRTILADPPWQFQNRTGKVAPEHKRLSRYETLTLDDRPTYDLLTRGDWCDVISSTVCVPRTTLRICTCGFPTRCCRMGWMS